MQRAKSFQPPTRRHPRRHIAEEFEIPGEMVDRHGDERCAAGDVDGVDAPAFGLGSLRHVLPWYSLLTVADR